MFSKLFVFIFFVSFSIFSQNFPTDLWHNGMLITNEGDSIKGNLKYDFDNQSIQLDDGKTIKAFNVNNLFFFEIYDETIRDYRQFYSLMYEIGYNYRVPSLFEVVIEGKLSLLLKEKIIAESVPSYYPSYYTYSLIPSYNYYSKLEYDYFFLNKEGKIQKFKSKGKKKQILLLMNDNYDIVKNFLSSNKINLSKMEDLVKVVEFYNNI